MAEPTEGFITLHRRIQEHPYWKDPERLRAWLDILFMAAWRPHRREIGNARYVELERGEFIASEPFLALRWRWSRGKVRRFLQAAEKAGEIRTIGGTSDGTRFLVVKYDDYQDTRPASSTTGGTGNRPRSGTGKTVGGASSPHEPGQEVVQATGHNRSKEKKEEKKNASRSKKRRAHQLPDDWKPNDHHRELARSLGVDLEGEWSHFRDHHLAKASTYVDWDRAFNTWLRRAVQFNRGKAPHPDSQAAKVKRSGTELPRGSDDRMDDDALVAWWKEHHLEEAKRIWNDVKVDLADRWKPLADDGKTEKAQEIVQREWTRRVLVEARSASRSLRVVNE